MTELRKSCNFCRQRRMKCNGELPWCAACNERGFPCVYESIGARGRPRRKDGDGDRSLICPKPVSSSRPPTANGEGFLNAPSSYFDLANTSSGSSSSNGTVNLALGGGGISRMVAEELMNVDNQIEASLPNLDTMLSPATLINSDPEQSILNLMEQLLSLSTGDTSLDPSPNLHTLRMDNMRSLRSEALQVNPDRPILTSAQLMQLIDLAFIHHPFLSLIVSKTALLYDHRDGMAHPSLLFAIAAEGLELGVPSSEAIFESGSLPSLEVLSEQAAYELRRSNFDLGDTHLTMSLCQVLLLTSHRMLQTSQIRRASVYLCLCCRTLDMIQQRNDQGSLTEVKMNGVLMATVDEELFHNIHWMASSFAFWIKLQYPPIGNFLGLMYRLDETCLPNLNPRQSAIYQLDLMSRNLSVLRAQEKASGNLYCLAYVYNMIDQHLNMATAGPVSTVSPQVAHLDTSVEKLLGSATRLLGLKTCFLIPTTPSSSQQIMIGASHIQNILAFANGLLDASTSMNQQSIATTQQQVNHARSHIQSSTVRLHVEAIANLVYSFEIFCAFCLPPPYRPQQAIFQRYCTSESDAELIDANKWHMISILQSLEVVLVSEAMSCSQRLSVQRRVAQLLAGITGVLPLVEMDVLSRPTTTTTNTTTTAPSTNFFPSPQTTQQHLHNQVLPISFPGIMAEQNEWDPNAPSSYFSSTGGGGLLENPPSPQYYSLGMHEWDEKPHEKSNSSSSNNNSNKRKFTASDLQSIQQESQVSLTHAAHHQLHHDDDGPESLSAVKNVQQQVTMLSQAGPRRLSAVIDESMAAVGSCNVADLLTMQQQASDNEKGVSIHGRAYNAYANDPHLVHLHQHQQQQQLQQHPHNIQHHHNAPSSYGSHNLKAGSYAMSPPSIPLHYGSRQM